MLEATNTARGVGDAGYLDLYIPAAVGLDSQCPLAPGEEFRVEIVATPTGNALVVTRAADHLDVAGLDLRQNGAITDE